MVKMLNKRFIDRCLGNFTTQNFAIGFHWVTRIFELWRLMQKPLPIWPI